MEKLVRASDIKPGSFLIHMGHTYRKINEIWVERGRVHLNVSGLDPFSVWPEDTVLVDEK